MKPAFSVCRTSDVYIGPAARLLPDLLPEGRVIAVTDDEVYRCHGELLAPFETIRIGRGERCKTLATVEELCRRLIAAGADRKTFILGVGGGIVTDVAGFAAATYMRGVGFGFVSTTLLGQVDASVGGKNGVNVAGYKNMVGTFTQPRFVVCDPSLLATLPDREFRAGLAEAAKAVADHCGQRILYISVANNLSVDCDCDSSPEDPRMGDIGILASLDPVALDRACTDLVRASDDPGKIHLIERIDSRHGMHTLDWAEALGMGSQRYELVTLDYPAIAQETHANP